MDSGFRRNDGSGAAGSPVRLMSAGNACIARIRKNRTERYTGRPGPAILVLRLGALGARIPRAASAPATAAAGS
ncbi:hypothetical protein ACI2IY_20200 [Lysobacter enzymogenes]|uniref:hypothetical protein n=1 Tax=Lysobacter enzymogenes TaxID=69 RepID=UPI00384A784A